MSKFIMLVGIPGCGKSTYTKKEYGKDENTVIISSDEIRKTLNLAPGTGNDIVFKSMLDQALSALKSDKTVVYDATNLARKRRVGVLNSFRKIKSCEFECIFFAETINVCKYRNSQRTGFDLVPDDVYLKMLKSFDIPMYWEGWDKITVIQTEITPHLANYYMEATKAFEQDNKHHTLSLYDHNKKTNDIVKSKVEACSDEIAYYAPVLQASLWHDIGKIMTKDFHNAYGDRTTDAHYYGHDKVGAYMYITSRKLPPKSVVYAKDINLIDYTVSEEFFTAALINWHMRPYFESKMKKSKVEAEHKMLGERFMKNLMLLHEADELAH